MKFFITLTVVGQNFSYSKWLHRRCDKWIMGESNVNIVVLKLLTYVDCGGKVDSVIEVLVK